MKTCSLLQTNASIEVLLIDGQPSVLTWGPQIKSDTQQIQGWGAHSAKNLRPSALQTMKRTRVALHLLHLNLHPSPAQLQVLGEMASPGTRKRRF